MIESLNAVWPWITMIITAVIIAAMYENVKDGGRVYQTDNEGGRVQDGEPAKGCAFALLLTIFLVATVVGFTRFFL
jgi:hypothetical protein